MSKTAVGGIKSYKVTPTIYSRELGVGVKLTKNEIENLVRCKKFTSRSWGHSNEGGRRYLPYAFTEQGIYMLMAVLKGELATKQSISLIKAFQQMKDYIIESNDFLLNTNPYIESKSIYHCGASSKDAGKRITTINKIEEKELYKPLIEEILTNGDLDM